MRTPGHAVRHPRPLLTAAVFFVAMWLTAPFVAAEESTPAAPADNRVSLRLPLVVYASSAAADLYTTHAALSRGVFYEKNPMGSWLDRRPTALVAFSATADAAIVWGLHRWLGPRHSRLLRAGLYAASGVRFWLAARNASATRAYDRHGVAGVR